MNIAAVLKKKFARIGGTFPPLKKRTAQLGGKMTVRGKREEVRLGFAIQNEAVRLTWVLPATLEKSTLSWGGKNVKRLSLDASCWNLIRWQVPG